MVSVGTPLGAALANSFTGHRDQNWIAKFDKSKVFSYKRSVDEKNLYFLHDQKLKHAEIFQSPKP